MVNLLKLKIEFVSVLTVYSSIEEKHANMLFLCNEYSAFLNYHKIEYMLLTLSENHVLISFTKDGQLSKLRYFDFISTFTSSMVYEFNRMITINSIINE